MSDDVPVQSFFDERLDMAYWYPKLESVDVPMPETYELPLDRSGEGPPEWDTDKAVSIVETLGGKAFVRSGFASARNPMSLGGVICEPDREHIELVLLDLGSEQKMMKLPIGKSFWFREYLDIEFCVHSDDTRKFVRLSATARLFATTRDTKPTTPFTASQLSPISTWGGKAVGRAKPCRN